MTRIRLGIVAAEFNYEITYAMVELAKEHARFLNASVVSLIRVPGVFDMPLAVKRMLEKEDINGVVALGAVIEGKTQHDEIVAQHASRKISDLSLEYEKPVGLGIAGPGMSRLEAHERVEYAKRAVEAAVKMCKILQANPGYGRKHDEDEGDDDNYDDLPDVGSFMEVG
ncbi:MAG: 6,7-dimethyl-8-ribityllumazine synthase [Candidatus Altiarchaeales archaeon ex4484_2]|nr:MAG: 6,7-dimethyl-8-ribityllumazine synthase [Candidatus Altiarchaeales archaeon ex4484_2]